MPREDVEMRCVEEQEPLEVVLPRARLNPRIPPIERHNNMKILDMLSTEVGSAYVEGREIGEQHRMELLDEDVYRSWCAACVEGRGVGGQRRI